MAIMALAADKDKSEIRDMIRWLDPEDQADWKAWPDSRKDAMIQEFRNDIMAAAQAGNGQQLRDIVQLRSLDWAIRDQVLLDDAVLEDSEDTCLHIAARKADMDLLFIVCHGFNDRVFHWETEKMRFLIVKQNAYGDSPLHCAARAGHVDVVVSLLADWTGPFRLETLKAESKVWPPDWGIGPEQRALDLELLDIKNKAGKTAAEEAGNAGHTDIAYWLVHLRPDPTSAA